MIINVLGDSITEGAAASSVENTFVSLLGKELNATVHNYGISGSRIAKQHVPSECPRFDLFFGSRVKDLDPKADFTIVFGGTNDYGHGDAPIGNKDDKAPDTFYGGMNYLISELLKKFDKNQLVFVLPLYRKNEENPYGEGLKSIPCLTLQGYRDIMTEVLNSNNLEVLDLKDEFGKPEESDLYQDGLHPNDKGHLKLANFIVDYIKAK